MISKNYSSCKINRTNTKKNHKYEALLYKFLLHEDKKDSYSYRIPFQGNKNQEFSYTYNYNIRKGNLIDTWWSIPNNNPIPDINGNTDRKYFDWNFINFGLTEASHIVSWIDMSIGNTTIDPYQIVNEFNIYHEAPDDGKKRYFEERSSFISKGQANQKLIERDNKKEFFSSRIYKKIKQSRKKITKSHKKKKEKKTPF